MSKIILASKSIARRKLLLEAGVEFEVHSSGFDERAHERRFMASHEHGLAIADATALAGELASAKAEIVSNEYPSRLVIGADQVMYMDGEILHQTSTLDELAARFEYLRGKSHMLISAASLAINGRIKYSYCESATLTAREWSGDFIARLIARTRADTPSDTASDTTSDMAVGGYRIESADLQMFASIEGSNHVVLGMPILKVLEWLRLERAIES